MADQAYPGQTVSGPVAQDNTQAPVSNTDTSGTQYVQIAGIGIVGVPSRLGTGQELDDFVNNVVKPDLLPKPSAPGVGGAIAEGVKEGGIGAFRDVTQSAQALKGQAPAEQPAPPQDQFSSLRAPLDYSLGMPNLPKLAFHAAQAITRSSPAMAAFAAGDFAGTMVAGPIGGLIAGAGGAGAVSAFQSVGPYLSQNLKANPKNPDAAWDLSWKQAAADGAISAASFGLFGIGARSGVLKHIAFQALGIQPAVGMAGAGLQGQIAGKAPTGAELAQTALESAAGTAIPLAAFGALGKLRGAPTQTDLRANPELASAIDRIVQGRPQPTKAQSALPPPAALSQSFETPIGNLTGQEVVDWLKTNSNIPDAQKLVQKIAASGGGVDKLIEGGKALLGKAQGTAGVIPLGDPEAAMRAQVAGAYGAPTELPERGPYSPQASTAKETEAVPETDQRPVLGEPWAIVNRHLDQLRSYGRQGRIVANGVTSALKDNTLTAPQVYAAFQAGQVLARVLPGTADHRVEFVNHILDQAPDAVANSGGAEGNPTGLRYRPTDGADGLIKLALDNNVTAENAAHEGMHVVEDYFRQYDPKTYSLLDKQFRLDSKYTADQVDPGVKRMLQNLQDPNSPGTSAWDAITQKYGLGTNPIEGREWMAYAFGQYDSAQASGMANIQGILPATRRFFNALRNLKTSLGNSLRGMGFRTSEDVFNSVSRGQMQRTANPVPVGSGAQASMAEGDPSGISTPDQAIRYLKENTVHTDPENDLGYGNPMDYVSQARTEWAKRNAVPIWYSPLQKAVESIRQEKASGDQWRATISKLPGVKPDEMKWTGLDDLLNKPGNHTKAEILQHLAENSVQVKDVIRSADWAQSDHEATKYSQYTLPGGENYKELLLTLPQMGGGGVKPRYTVESGAGGRWLVRDNSSGNVLAEGISEIRQRHLAAEYNRQVGNYHVATPAFQSSHWDEPNVLAHIRFDERRDSDDKPTLFLQEIQSDWHQKGREQGYQTPPDISTRPPEPQQYQDWLLSLGAREQDIPPSAGAFKVVDPVNYQNWLHQYNDATVKIRNWEQAARAGVPDAPFKSTEAWAGMSMRRMIRWAAEHGFDKLAWTTGEQQAERYNLAHQVDSVSVGKSQATPDSPIIYHVNAERNSRSVINQGMLGESELRTLIGRELAEKAIAKLSKPMDERFSVKMRLGHLDPAAPPWGVFDGDTLIDSYQSQRSAKERLETLTEGTGLASFSGLDLKLGGEGMKTFYDKMLPGIAEKLGKKFGAKVEATELRGEEDWIQRLNRMYPDEFDSAITRAYESDRPEEARALVKARKASETFLRTERVTDQPSRVISKEIATKYFKFIPKNGPLTHSLTITPEMKASALKMGMPQFSLAKDRAEKAGFDTSQTWYHGSPNGKAILRDGKFDTARMGQNGLFGPAIYASDWDKEADEYAHAQVTGGGVPISAPDPAVLGLWTKISNPLDANAWYTPSQARALGVDAQDSIRGDDLYAKIRSNHAGDALATNNFLLRKGFDAVKYTSYSQGNQTRTRNLAILDRTKVRTTDGSFDPENLQASIASNKEEKIRALMGGAIPGLARILPDLTMEERREITQQGAKSLVDIVRNFPVDPKEMAAVAWSGRAKKGWYENSAKTIQDVFGPTDAPRFAGLLAALSPQMGVAENLNNALRMWTSWIKSGRPVDQVSINRLLDREYRGIAKDAARNNVQRALMSEDGEIVRLSGPKVSSFMMNLLNSVREVTNDTWMANYAGIDADEFKGRPVPGVKPDQSGAVLGKAPGYLAMAVVARRAADHLSRVSGQTWTPREIQETVWSWAKALYELRDGRDNGLSRSAKKILDENGLSAARINSVPDFSTLFTHEVYSNILKEAGYEVPRGSGIGGGAGDLSAADPYSAEGSGFAPEDYRRHLGRAAGRLEGLYQRRLANSAEKISEKIAKTGQESFPFAGGKSIQGGYPQASIARQAPNESTRLQADHYKDLSGISKAPLREWLTPNESYLKRVADWQEQAQDDARSPETAKTYDALKRETLAQYHAMGPLEIIPNESTSEPYKNSKEMMDDVRKGKLRFYMTETAFGDGEDNSKHPLLAATNLKNTHGAPLLYNDIFRIVHDYFGHTQNGFQFGPLGEYNAFHEHSRMYSDEAIPALATETLAQNAWVNYGPHLRRADNSVPREGEDGYVEPAKRPYSPQKAYAFPQDILREDTNPVAFDDPKLTPTAQASFAKVIEDKGYVKDRDSGTVAWGKPIPKAAVSAMGGEGMRGKIVYPVGDPSFGKNHIASNPERLAVLRNLGFRNDEDAVRWIASNWSWINDRDDGRFSINGERVINGVRFVVRAALANVKDEGRPTDKFAVITVVPSEGIGNRLVYGTHPKIDSNVVRPERTLAVQSEQIIHDATQASVAAFLGKHFAPDSRSSWDTVRRKLQDYFLPVKRYEELLGKEGTPVPETSSVYLAEELYHTRVGRRLREAEDHLFSPVVEAIAKGSITPKEFGQYLLAKHAEERNLAVAARNPKLPDGGSGMKTQDARDFLKKIASDPRLNAYEGARKLFAKITDDTTRIRVEGGLIPADAPGKSPFQYYAPLMGWLEDPEGIPPESARTGGSGFDIRGKESRTFTGRTSEPGDILSHALMQHQEAVVRSEKNRVGQTLLRLAKDHPDDFDINTTILEPKFNQKTGLVEYKFDPTSRMAENIVAVKENGKVSYITMFDPLFAKAMKKLGASNTGGFLRAMGAITGYLSKINTSLSPEFIITNLTRTFVESAINISRKEIDGLAFKVMKGVPAAIKGGVDSVFTGKDTPMARLHKQMMQDGGGMEFMGLGDLRSQEQHIRDLFNKWDPNRGMTGSARQAWNKTWQFIRDANHVVEGGTRLSTYNEALKLGMSRAQAAHLAKNVNLNFARKGEWGPAINALYMFYNAAAQTSATMFNSLKSPRVRKIVAGMFIMSAAMEYLNQVTAPVGADGQNMYDKLEEQKKDFNLIIPSFFNTADNYHPITLPLPIGYRFFTLIARNVAAAALFGKKPFDAAKDMLNYGIESFNPLGGSSTMIGHLFPTISRPFVDVAANTNYFGNAIHPTQSPFGTPKPNSQVAFQGTSDLSKAVAQGLNSATGGNTVRPGAIDLHPEDISYLFDFITGSAGGMMNRLKTLGLYGLETTGDLPDSMKPPQPMGINDVPFLRRVLGSVNPHIDQQNFNTALTDVNYAEQELKNAIKTGDVSEVARIRQDEGTKIALFGQFHAADQQIQRLRSNLKKLAVNVNIPAAQKDQIKAATESQIAAILLRVNRTYHQRVLS